VLTQLACLGAGGLPQGAGTVCQPNPCPQPPGACCLPNGTCTFVAEETCTELGGAFQGDFVPCTPSLCQPPVGACCFPNGSCIQVSQQVCGSAGGLYQGDSTMCTPGLCPPPSGACCFPDGSCLVLSQSDCLAGGGNYQGDDTSCTPFLCPPPMGACCFPNGQCNDNLAQDDCFKLGGAYQGDFTTCDAVVCPPRSGACCLPDGACIEVTETECAAQGGIFQGPQTICAGVDCPQPPGACCFSECDDDDDDGDDDCPDDGDDDDGDGGMCLDLTMEECVAQGGQFQGSGTSCSTVDCPDGEGLIIIDEETIDNGRFSVEWFADMHGVAPDFLVNDDDPTEVGNPPLRWNVLFPGDVVVLPGGQVDEEGFFALPPDTPFTLADYVAGTVPQSALDPVFDVMPFRNHDLYDLVGKTCVAVVYDSDISMNYLPIQGNLQGARYGLFRFQVLDVVVPGSLPESGSSTSLYDVMLMVLPPAEPTFRHALPIRDHEPDSISITRARYTDSTDLLQVWGVSNFAPGAVMTVSVQDFILEAPMTYNPAQGRYEYTVVTPVDLDGRRVLISTDEGGAYNAYIE
jgi:hypothetical protein